MNGELEPQLRTFLAALAAEADTDVDLVGPVRARVRRARLVRVGAASAVVVAACVLFAGFALARPAGVDVNFAGPGGSATALPASSMVPPAPSGVTTTSPGLVTTTTRPPAPAARDCSLPITSAPQSLYPDSEPPRPLSPNMYWAVQLPAGSSLTGVATQFQYSGVTLNFGPSTKYHENNVECVHPQLAAGQWVDVQATEAGPANTYDVTAVYFGSHAPGLPDTSAPAVTTTWAPPDGSNGPGGP
jgi:hypothetical protein